MPIPTVWKSDFIVAADAVSEDNVSLTAFRDGRFAISYDIALNNGDLQTNIYGSGAPGVNGTSIQSLINNNGSSETQSSITALSNGGMVKVWADNSSGNSDIFMQVYGLLGNGTLAPITGITLVNTTMTAGDQTKPEVTQLAGSNFVVAWREGYVVSAQVFGIAGAPAGSPLPFAVNVPAYDDISLTPLRVGNFVLNHHGTSAVGGLFDLSLFGPAGGFIGDRNVMVDGAASVKAQAQLSSGVLIAASTSDLVNGFRYIFLEESSLVSLGGASIYTAPAAVSGIATLKIAALTDGRAMVVFSETGGDKDIWGQIIGANGILDGATFKINTQAVGDQVHPDVEVLADGRVLVSWTDLNAGAGNIVAKIYDPREAGVSVFGKLNNANEFHGSAFGDHLEGSNLADQLYGAGGDDNLTGFGGDDLLDGGSGSDSVYYSPGFSPFNIDLRNAVQSATGGAGTDTLVSIENIAIDPFTGSTNALTLTGNDLANRFFTAGGDDILTMLGGNDFASGNAGMDTISGGEGADTLRGDGDTDFLYGDAGDDTLDGGSGIDELHGGSGTNTMMGGTEGDYYYVDSATDLILAELAGAEIDSIITTVSFFMPVNVEVMYLGGTGNINATGRADQNETLYGNNGNNVLNGLGGADFMEGSLGNDTYYVDDLGDLVAEFSGLSDGNDLIYASLSWTNAANVESLTLTGNLSISATGLDGQNDRLTGNSAANSLFGLSGNDILDGGLGVDTMDGGDDSDVYYANVINDIISETNAVLATGGSDTVYFTGTAGTFTLSANVERLVLSGTAATNGTGNALANTIVGNSAANTLDGGIDALADALYGNGGNDTFIINTAGDNIIELAGGGNADRAKASVSFTLGVGDNIEFLETTNAAGIGAINLTGNEVQQSITGNAGANVLNGGIDAVADVLTGGLGNDTYIINTANDNIVELAGGGTADRAKASLSFTLVAGDNIEFLETTNAAGVTAINLVGNEIAQTITGNAGANVLNGGVDALADTMIGGLGNDVYVINSAIDNITEVVGGGTADRAVLNVSFALAAGDNIEIMTTANAALTTAINLAGNEIAQSIVGNAGANIIAGGLGNDTLTGGLGNDFFLFNTALNAALNRDVIADFNVVADTMQLENAIFTGLGVATGVLAAGMFKNLTTGGLVDADDRILYNDATGALLYDSDGSGVSAAVQFATLSGSPTVFFDDFIVV